MNKRGKRKLLRAKKKPPKPPYYTLYMTLVFSFDMYYDSFNLPDATSLRLFATNSMRYFKAMLNGPQLTSCHDVIFGFFKLKYSNSGIVSEKSLCDIKSYIEFTNDKWLEFNAQKHHHSLSENDISISEYQKCRCIERFKDELKERPKDRPFYLSFPMNFL